MFGRFTKLIPKEIVSQVEKQAKIDLGVCWSMFGFFFFLFFFLSHVTPFKTATARTAMRRRRHATDSRNSIRATKCRSRTSLATRRRF